MHDRGFCRRHEGDDALAEFVGPLRDKASELGRLSQAVASRVARDPAEIGAAAYDYLFHCGYVALAYWWARAVAAADASSQPQALADAKRATARFYYARVLPRTLAHAAVIDSGAAALMQPHDEDFDA